MGAQKKSQQSSEVDEQPPQDLLTMTEFRKIMSNFDSKLDKVTEKVDFALKEMDNFIKGEVCKIISRIEKIEKQIETSNITNSEPKDPLSVIEKCIVISNLPFDHQEDFEHKVATLLEVMDCGDISIEACKRMGRAPHPLVKVAISPPNKYKILQKKGCLRYKAGYERIFIRTSKTMSERLQEANMKTITSVLPGLKLVGNKLVPASTTTTPAVNMINNNHQGNKLFNNNNASPQNTLTNSTYMSQSQGQAHNAHNYLPQETNNKGYTPQVPSNIPPPQSIDHMYAMQHGPQVPQGAIGNFAGQIQPTTVSAYIPQASNIVQGSTRTFAGIVDATQNVQKVMQNDSQNK